MKQETTLLLVKPDSVKRGIIGQILSRFENKGLTIAAMKLIWLEEEKARELYKPHVGKPFYEPTVKYMTSSPIVAVALRGFDAINIVRKLNGATRPNEADPGTIRGDFGQRVDFNCVHGSDSPENAQRELAIFFNEKELLNYERSLEEWI
ncbi:MAG: nucleoside-diphosphate kinase [Vulcanimicrobiota bacterium]